MMLRWTIPAASLCALGILSAGIAPSTGATSTAAAVSCRGKLPRGSSGIVGAIYLVGGPPERHGKTRVSGPVAGTVVLQGTHNKTVASCSVSDDKRFAVALGPGHFAVFARLAPSEPRFGCGRVRVTVVRGRSTTVRLKCNIP
jgi:hypothetical protein